MPWPENLAPYQSVLRDAAGTLALLLVLILLRVFTLRAFQRVSWATEEHRLRWRMQTRRAVLLLFGLGLFVIWSSELRTFALSVVAVAAAFVIATKELILCVMGSLFRLSSASFRVGDRVDVGGARGDVIDTGILSTRLLELGPASQYTGRTITIPNSILLSGNTINETTESGFVLHVIHVPLALDTDWREHEAALLHAAQEVCTRFIEQTRASLYNAMPEEAQEAAHPVSAQPTTLVQFKTPTELEVLLRVPTPARDKGTIEQAILRRFLDARANHSTQAPPTDPTG